MKKVFIFLLCLEAMHISADQPKKIQSIINQPGFTSLPQDMQFEILGKTLDKNNLFKSLQSLYSLRLVNKEFQTIITGENIQTILAREQLTQDQLTQAAIDACKYWDKAPKRQEAQGKEIEPEMQIIIILMQQLDKQHLTKLVLDTYPSICTKFAAENIDLNARNQEHLTILSLAIKSGRYGLAKKLIMAGADINAPFEQNPDITMIRAARDIASKTSKNDPKYVKYQKISGLLDGAQAMQEYLKSKTKK